MKINSFNNKKENKDNFLTKIIFFILIIFLLLSSFIGSLVGLFNYSSDDYKINSNYKNYYNMQVEIEYFDSDKNVEFVSNYIEDTFLFFGIYDTKVDVINNNNLNVYFSIDEFGFGNDRYSEISEQNHKDEIISNLVILLNNSMIEFRTPEGEMLIDEFGNFVEPELPTPEGGGENGGGTITTPPGKIESYDSKIDLPGEINTYDFSLIEEAWVDYNQGYPVIKFIPTEEARGSFRDAWKFLFENSSVPTETGEIVDLNKYVVWFGYDILEYLVSNFDAENYSNANNNLLTYIYIDEDGNQLSEPKDFARPFFVSYGSVKEKLNIYRDEFTLYGNFSKKQAENIVRRINFSKEKIDLSISNTSLVYNDVSFSSVYWVIFFFLTIIILLSFFFISWFGLLGVIASTINLLFALILISSIGFFSIYLSLLLVFFVFLISLYLFFIEYITLKRFLTNFDKNKKKTLKIKEDFLFVSNYLLPFSVILILFMGVFGIFATSFFKIYFYLFFLSLFICLFFLYTLFIPSIILIDYIFNIFDQKNNNKWNFLTGVNTKYYSNLGNNFSKRYKNLEGNNKNIRKFSLVGIIFLIVSLFLISFFSILKGGQLVNTTNISKDYYKYDLVRVEKIPVYSNDIEYEIKDYEIINIDDEKSNDRYNQKVFEKQTKDDYNEIEKLFSKNDIEIFYYELNRYENYNFIKKSEIPGGEDEFHFTTTYSYGFSIYTKNKIDSNLINDLINKTFSNDLNKNENIFSISDDEQTSWLSDEEIESRIENYQYYYWIKDSSSLVNGIDDQHLIKNSYFEEKFLINSIFKFVLLMFIVFIMFTLFFNFSVAFSTILSLFLEIIILVGISLLLFIPFISSFFTILFWFILLSTISKAILLERKSNKRKISFKFETFIFTQKIFSINLVFSVLFIYLFGFGIFILFLFSLISLFLIPLINLKFYIPIIKTNNEKFILKENITWDILEKKSIDKNYISEEFIEGVNKPKKQNYEK